MLKDILRVKVQLNDVNSVNSIVFIAEYTEFKITQTLWKHLKEKNVKKILKKYYTLCQEKAVSKILDSLSLKITHFVFRNSLYVEIITFSSLLQKDDIVSDDMIFYVIMIWVACCLLKKRLEILLDFKVFKKCDLLKNITSEDFNRALHVLWFVWKQWQKIKKTDVKSDRQKRLAIKIKYASFKTNTVEKT